jgi:multidrug efflux system membrane fusion protein
LTSSVDSSSKVPPSKPSGARRTLLAGAAILAVGGAATYWGLPYLQAGKVQAAAPTASAPAPIPVSVARVELREAPLWDEFSGRLEAVERVEVRSRVAGAIQAVHFAEGELVKAGDPLVSIDPAPYEADVRRAEAQLAAAKARVVLTASEVERGQKLWDSKTVSLKDLETRVNAHREAQANVQAAEANLQTSRLSLGYTQVRAPVSGRVGRREITVGNLVQAGPGSPVLTTLVSVDPIYGSFHVDEGVIGRALQAVASSAPGGHARGRIDRIPVQMANAQGATTNGRLQLIDNQVEAQTGTVRVRAVFQNADGALMPGQFARLRLGQVQAGRALLVDERAVGTDQDKKFVMVVGPDDVVSYRAVTLGPAVGTLRIVAQGLSDGERIVVNGLQRVRPGAKVRPEAVAMGQRGPTVVASAGQN